MVTACFRFSNDIYLKAIGTNMNTDLQKRTGEGYVSFFSRAKKFGSIESLDNGEEIYFRKNECVKEYKNVYEGDHVEFEFDEHEGKPCAGNVRFIGNASIDGLRRDFEKGTILQGYLKKVENKYYIKDINNYFFIRLNIGPNEVDIEEVYDNSINEKREFKIVSISERNAMKAVLLHRKFNPEYVHIVKGGTYDAEVLTDQKSGYRVQLKCNGINGCLYYKWADKKNNPLELGSVVEVRCTTVSPGFAQIIFELVSNVKIKVPRPDKIAILKAAQLSQLSELAARKTAQLSHLSLGSVIICRVKSIEPFGVFVNFGFADGLIHLSSFLPPESKPYAKTERQVLQKLLTDLMPVDTELVGVILNIEGSRCAMDLDMSIATNATIKAAFEERRLEVFGI